MGFWGVLVLYGQSVVGEGTGGSGPGERPDGEKGRGMSDRSGADGQWMDLADAVTLLRKQIAEAQGRLVDPAGGGDKGVLFSLGEITVELGLELTRSSGVNGGLRWSVISLGGKKESGMKDTHKLTVKLTPHTPDGRDVDISDTE